MTLTYFTWKELRSKLSLTYLADDDDGKVDETYLEKLRFIKLTTYDQVEEFEQLAAKKFRIDGHTLTTWDSGILISAANWRNFNTWPKPVSVKEEIERSLPLCVAIEN